MEDATNWRTTPPLALDPKNYRANFRDEFVSGAPAEPLVFVGGAAAPVAPPLEAGSEPVMFRISDRRRPPFRRRRNDDGAPTPLPARVESLLARDATYRRRLREVLSRQRALKAQVTVLGWRAYLELEEAEFDRWMRVIDCVARWAITRGRRERGRR